MLGDVYKSQAPGRDKAAPSRLATQKSAAPFPKSGTFLFKTVQYKNPKITRDAAPQTAIITTAARMGGSHCRARPG